MRKLACLVLLLAFPATSQAQNTSDPRAWAEQFLKTIVEDGPKEAHRLLLNNGDCILDVPKRPSVNVKILV
jgi:hypothetical protein